MEKISANLVITKYVKELYKFVPKIKESTNRFSNLNPDRLQWTCECNIILHTESELQDHIKKHINQKLREIFSGVVSQ